MNLELAQPDPRTLRIALPAVAIGAALMVVLVRACSEDRPPRTAEGAKAHEHLGWRVCVTDDVDGDGVRDIAAVTGVGRCALAPPSDASVGGTAVARLTIFSGATRAPLRTIAGLTPGAEMGWRLANGPDLDGDGVRDLVVTTPGVAGQRSGVAQVVSPATGKELTHYEGTLHEHFGTELSLGHDFDANGVEDVALFSISSSRDELTVFSGIDWRVLGRVPSPMQAMDVRLTSAGDVDGDGVGDLLLSGIDHAIACSGKRLDELARYEPGSTGAVLSSVGAVGVGDLDRDGSADVLVTDRSGRGWLYSGVEGRLVGRVDGPGTWDDVRAVSAGGDVDGDGVPDFAVSYVRHILDQAQTVVVWSGATRAALCQLQLDPGSRRDAEFGRAIDLSADLDGDGRADLVVGLPEQSTEHEHAGAVTVYFASELLAE